MTSVPGSNLLKTALSVIGNQSFYYYRFLARSSNPNGQYVTIYNPPARLNGSIQPVPRTLYDVYGLDLQKHYITLFVSADVLDISRDISGDLIMYRGQMYQSLSKTKWFQQDGWGSVIFAQVQDQSLIESFSLPSPSDYTTGQTLTFIVEFSLDVSVNGAPAINLDIGGVARQAVYVSGTQKMIFQYQAQMGDSGSLTIPVVSPSTLPSIDLSQGSITTCGGVPANVTFSIPNVNGISINA